MDVVGVGMPATTERRPTDGVSAKRLRTVGVMALEFTVYSLVYLLLEPRIGRTAAIFAILPVFAGAMHGGIKGGVIVASLAITLNAIFFTFIDSGAAIHGFRATDLPGNLALLVIGALAGLMRNRQVGMATEIAERRAVERAAREAEQRLQAILTSAPTMIAMLDPAGGLLFVNRGNDNSPASLGDRSLFDFVAPEDHERVREALRTVVEDQIEVDLEIGIILRDGAHRYFRGVLAPMRGEASPNTIIVNATDVTELRELEQLRARFVDKVVTAQEKERRRIAHELHDVTAQALTSLLIGLRVIGELPDEASKEQRLAELRELAGDTLDDLNRLARGLHPSVLDDVGFKAALERYCTEFSKTHGVEVQLEIIGLDIGDRLPTPIEITLYRITQEALTNVAKHADATRASVVVERRESSVRVIIEDDGRGIELNEATGMPQETDGLGLLGIRERAQLVGGEVTIETGQGGGTTLFVTLPAPPSVIEMYAS